MGQGSGAVGSAPDVAGATSAVGVRIDGGQNAEQGRAAAGPRRLPAATDTGDGARPLEAGMQRCRLLGIRRTHRTETPRKDRGRSQNRTAPPQSMAPRQTHVSPAPRHRPDAGITTIPDDPPPETIERQSQNKPNGSKRKHPEVNGSERVPKISEARSRESRKIGSQTESRCGCRSLDSSHIFLRWGIRSYRSGESPSMGSFQNRNGRDGGDDLCCCFGGLRHLGRNLGQVRADRQEHQQGA